MDNTVVDVVQGQTNCKGTVGQYDGVVKDTAWETGTYNTAHGLCGHDMQVKTKISLLLCRYKGTSMKELEQQSFL